MNEPIITIDHLTMSFTIEHRHYGFKGAILHFYNFVKEKLNVARFTALNDVSLTIHKGERVGIVGHNGCGKTTILSVIGGVYKRYRGTVKVDGRVSMMLALGAGFDLHLSGRDNIMLNGVLQGKTKAEMRDLIQDIIDFADIGEFIDAPMYTYSSGMIARVAFGVSTAINPDILIVDEVMAVGDEDFKNKCAARIGRLLEGGTTLLLVSHSPSDIKKYCNRVIRLDHGRVVYDGDVAGSGIA